MQTVNNQIENIHSDIDSTQFPNDGPVVKVNDGHLERILSDMEIIRSNKDAINQLSGEYQANSDGTFHSYSTEEVNTEGVNKVKIYIEAEYSSGNINGYTVHLTESDTAGNILGSVESQLDAEGTSIDDTNVESRMTSDAAADVITGKEWLLTESINSFPFQGDEMVNTVIANDIIVGAALACTIIGVY
ncbi:hypothetical protein QVN60_16105 [Yersinia aleksiciae]|uniref:hypothetical protein n=1 Tax=Yersinia aleksiciae TaxID=263819 RepID=UPI0011A94749|nr:hypothetical protein [Yersinia aleksiciae]MDN0124683.1 hypothetical protein [Yersinia aleksiciae]